MSAPGVLEWGWVVASSLESYVPRGANLVAWARIGDEARRVVLAAAPGSVYSLRELLTVVSRLGLWADGRGIPADVQRWLARETIEAFLAEGCPNTTAATRGNYRSRLLRVREAVLGPDYASGHPASYRGAPVQAPFSQDQVAALWAWSKALATGPARASAAVLLALGFGLGLASAEAVLVTAGAVHRDGPGAPVTVDIPGPRARTGVCRANWEHVLWQATLTAQQDFTTGGECGARAVRIIVPPGIRHIGGELGHNDLYFMDGPCAAGGVVPVFSDPAFEPLGLGEFIAAQRAEDAERRAEVEEDDQRGREAAAHSDIGIHLGRTPAR